MGVIMMGDGDDSHGNDEYCERREPSNPRHAQAKFHLFANRAKSRFADLK
jgi:hypothetical protein